MYRFAICDDDREFCRSFEGSLTGICREKMIGFTMDFFYDTVSFARALKEGAEYDLVFLDILLKDENGVDFARKLRSENCGFDLVFITSSREYAVESFDVSPLYYIVKPVSDEKLKTAVERFLKKYTPESVCFNIPGGYLHVKLPDIVYIEIFNHSVILHKADGSSKTFRGTLKEIESQMPQLLFLKPHRSYLVNPEHISRFSRSGIEVTDGTVIPVSRKLYEKVRLEFMGYLDKSGACI